MIASLNSDLIQAQFYSQQGFAYHQQGDYQTALGYYQRAHNTAPEWYLPIYHAAVCFHHLRQYSQAIDCYRQAIKRDQHDAQLRYHYAKALKDSGFVEDALPAYQQALNFNPHNVDAQYSLGLLHLLRGEWLLGWKGYEQRFQGSDRATVEQLPKTNLHRWQGEIPVSGSAIIIYSEQGMGDSIQCFRYARLLRSLFCRVKFSVHLPLVRLFEQNTPPDVSIVPRVSQAIDERGYSHYAMMMSLPALWKTTPQTVPALPYLHVDSYRQWSMMRKVANRPKVGLVWQGGKLSYAPARDIPYEYLAPLWQRSDIAWFSLQKDCPLVQESPLIDCMGDMADFYDTASFILQLDLIISVDTAVAHLAGALGKPVWLLNRYESEWRWMHRKTTSPWYPNLRLFNQIEPGNWVQVIDAVNTALLLEYPIEIE